MMTGYCYELTGSCLPIFEQWTHKGCLFKLGKRGTKRILLTAGTSGHGWPMNVINEDNSRNSEERVITVAADQDLKEIGSQ